MTTTATVQHIGVGIDTARYGHRVKFLRDDRQTAAQPLTVTENRQGVVTAAASHLEPVSVSQEGGGPIDYLFLREQISFERVLSEIGVLPALRGTAQRRGSCPLCNSGPARSFSVKLRKNIYQCFQPGCSSGNVLDFWAAYHRQPLHTAARHLADTFGLPTQRHPNP